MRGSRSRTAVGMFRPVRQSVICCALTPIPETAISSMSGPPASAKARCSADASACFLDPHRAA